MPVVIDESVKQAVKQRFQNLKNPVTLKVFSTKDHCLLCNEMIALIQEVKKMSDLISVETCNCEAEDPRAKKYGITDHPAVVIEGEKDYGIKFYGIPAGKEFTTLIESIMLVSGRDPALPPHVMDIVQKINKKVNLKVFVTLQCPYCPAMVIRAHKLALASDNISAEMIEASQFQELAAKFDIFGVPNTIINDGKGSVEGLVSDEALIKQIVEAIK